MKAFLSLLAILWNSAFRWVYLSFYPLPLAFQLFVRPPQTTIVPFCICFSWRWSWSSPPVQCQEHLSIVFEEWKEKTQTPALGECACWQKGRIPPLRCLGTFLSLSALKASAQQGPREDPQRAQNGWGPQGRNLHEGVLRKQTKWGFEGSGSWAIWSETVSSREAWNFLERKKDSISSVQSLSHVWIFATPWIAARQASLSITNSRSLLKLMPIELLMPSNHLTLCCPLRLLPPIPPSVRVFSNESPPASELSFWVTTQEPHTGLTVGGKHRHQEARLSL